MGNGGDVDCPPSAVPLTDADACEVAAKALSKAGIPGFRSPATLGNRRHKNV